MTGFTLPEERMLSGKAAALGAAPFQLDYQDDERTRYKEHARRVLEQGGHFPVDDLHQIIAKLVLGL